MSHDHWEAASEIAAEDLKGTCDKVRGWAYLLSRNGDPDAALAMIARHLVHLEREAMVLEVLIEQNTSIDVMDGIRTRARRAAAMELKSSGMGDFWLVD